MTEDLPLRPVAGWETGIIPAYHVGILTIQYLVSPMETPAQAHASPRFALTVPQLHELGQKMLSLAAALESTPQSSGGLPTH